MPSLKRFLQLLMLCTPGLLLLVSFLWGRGQVHDFANRCESCHLTFKDDGMPGKYTRNIDFLCMECHRVSAAYSHPTGMVPSFDVPAELSLDWSGRMTCATCHDPHGEHVAGGGDLLRTKYRGKLFCQQCHNYALPTEGRHGGTGGRAHFGGVTPLDSGRWSRLLDAVSAECLACHDGVVAPATSYRVGEEDESVTYSQRKLSHPIGIDYRRAAMRDRELRSPEALAPYITLFVGKIGCGSCHNVFSREKNLLVVNDRGSSLCFECHIK